MGDHNYCRNPDLEPSPWCYNAASTEPRWEVCDIPDLPFCELGKLCADTVRALAWQCWLWEYWTGLIILVIIQNQSSSYWVSNTKYQWSSYWLEILDNIWLSFLSRLSGSLPVSWLKIPLCYVRAVFILYSYLWSTRSPWISEECLQVSRHR